MTTKKIIIAVVILALAGFAYYIYPSKDTNIGATIEVEGDLYNVIGTRIGTTTTGVYLSATAASSSYPFVINTEVDTATFYLQATAASTTGAEFTFAVFGSSDYGCDTATTSAYLNYPEVEDIDWYDVGMLNLNVSGTTVVPVATTTYGWFSVATSPKKTVTLTELNTRCLKVEAHGSSTTMYMGVVTKSHKGGF